VGLRRHCHRRRSRAGDFLSDSLRNVASPIAMMRQHGGGDDRVIYLLMSWTETPLRNFHKL
jgi:hypothetical protein